MDGLPWEEQLTREEASRLTREERIEAIVNATIYLGHVNMQDVELFEGLKFMSTSMYASLHGGHYPTDEQLRDWLTTHRFTKCFWDAELERRAHESH